MLYILNTHLIIYKYILSETIGIFHEVIWIMEGQNLFLEDAQYFVMLLKSK